MNGIHEGMGAGVDGAERAREQNNRRTRFTPPNVCMYIQLCMCAMPPDASAPTLIRTKGGTLRCVRACATMPQRGLSPALQWLADTSFYIPCERRIF